MHYKYKRELSFILCLCSGRNENGDPSLTVALSGESLLGEVNGNIDLFQKT